MRCIPGNDSNNEEEVLFHFIDYCESIMRKPGIVEMHSCGKIITILHVHVQLLHDYNLKEAG